MASEQGRSNQRSRTRRDLLEAALRLSAEGKIATLEDIAKEARVSRATAYRYFPSVDDLLAEASLHVAFPEPACLSGASADPVERLFLIDDAVAEMIQSNEAALRVMVASASKVALESNILARQNRRLPLIEAALEPARSQFSPEVYLQLTRALSLVIGTESMLVFKDVLRLTPKQARDARRWTIRALVRSAQQC